MGNLKISQQSRWKVFCFSTSMLLISSPLISSFFIFLIVAQGFIPTLSVLVSIKLGDSIAAGYNESLLTYCIVWAVTLVLPSILSPIVSMLQGLLNQKATYLAQRKIMESAANVKDLKVFESTELHDILDLLSKEAAHRPLNLLVNLVDIFRSTITMLSLFLTISAVSWWVALALFVPAIPVTLAVSKSHMDGFKTILGKGRSARLIRYYISIFMDTTLSKEIRMLNLSGFFIKKHQEAFHDLDEGMRKVRMQQALSPQVWNLLYMISAVGVMWIFSKSIVAGGITIGGVLGVIQSIGYFGNSCQWLVYAVSNLGMCFNFFKRLMELEHISADEENKRELTTKIPKRKNIRFENVFFSYDGEKDVLKNINITINEGAHISLVGENGAGKSTLIKLLCGLYKPTKGRITIDGIDISMIDRKVWWSMFSTVFQDFGRYNLTIRENVTIGDVESEYNDERVISACNTASFRLYDAIGLSTFIGKEYSGTELSGGQWQRLALARALFSDRSFIILDEPTSSMDPRVENALFNKFSDLVEGRTSVIVTHRMGSIRKTDKVIVLKGGEVIEEGSIDELEILNGEYSELYRLQKSQYI